MKNIIGSVVLFSLLYFMFDSPVFAEELLAETKTDDVRTVTVLLNTIRWGGIIGSIFVVLFAWLLLRLLDGATGQLGTIFADKRLLFQKINAFMRFVIYLLAVPQAAENLVR